MDLNQALVLYGRESDENLVRLRSWRDEALEEIAAGKGAQLASGSGNGLAFTVSATTTVTQWFTALQGAITTVSQKQSSARVARF